MKILVTGPQGSGKTTISRLLSERLQMCLVKTGDLIRARALENDEVGNKLKQSLETGDLSDDRIVGDILKEKLLGPGCEGGFIVDGYPRRLSQLQVFDPGFDKVFDLDVSDQVARDRMLKRGRVDDVPELIDERLKLFHSMTSQVVNYYDNLGILYKIDGEQSIEKVVLDIQEILNS